MNRSIKSLILAVGVAAATVTVTVPAHADPFPGPGGLQQGPIVDPTPDPKPQPVPAGPGEIANPPKCTHGCGGDQGPQGPKDIAPAPADEDVVNGGPLEPLPPADQPGDGFTDDPADDPAHDATLDQGCFTGCDLPEEPAVEAVPAQLDLDAKFGAEPQTVLGDSAPAAIDQAGAHAGNLTWVLVATAGLLSALGALILAAVARRRRQQAGGAGAAA